MASAIQHDRFIGLRKAIYRTNKKAARRAAFLFPVGVWGGYFLRD
jgi:hypothetical protein